LVPGFRSFVIRHWSSVIRAAALSAPLALTPPAHSTVTIPYTTTAAAPRVSLALYDAQGRQVHTLLSGQLHAPGSYLATWDGRDRYGFPLPAGTYEWRLLETAGLRSEFVTAIGHSFNPAAGTMAVGNHNPPLSVAADTTGIYFGVGDAESAPVAAKTAPASGNVIWGNTATDGTTTGAASVRLGSAFYVLNFAGGVWGYDASSGAVITGNNGSPVPLDVNWTGPNPAPTTGLFARGLDLAADPVSPALIVSYRAENAIRWFSTAGALLDSATGLPTPLSVAANAAGLVHFIAADGAIYTVSRANKTPQLLIPASALSSPWRLAIDLADGAIFVAENSTPPRFNGDIRAEPAPASASHRVLRFSSAGVLQQTYGRADGRQDGDYIATDFYNLHDIASDAAGGFLVTEPYGPPRRVARFARDGSLLREWYGGQHWSVRASPEPDDGRIVWFATNPGGLVRARVDFATGETTVLETYARTLLPSGYRLVENNPRVFTHGGRTYLVAGPLNKDFFLAVHDPVARTLRYTNAELPNGFYNDANDDGIFSPSERVPGIAGGGWVEPATLRLRTTPVAADYLDGASYLPTAITPGGTPLYAATPSTPNLRLAVDGRTSSVNDYAPGPAGTLYGAVHDSWGFPFGMNEVYGYWYFNYNSALNRLARWDASGNLLWAVGRHSADADHAPGSTANARGLVGALPGGVIWADSSDAEVANPLAYTDDGLYIDELFRRNDGRDHALYFYRHGAELPEGQLWREPATGDLYVYLQSTSGGAPVFRVRGWGEWTRRSGTVTLAASPAPLAQNGSGLRADYFANATLSGSPVHTRTDPRVFTRWGRAAPAPGIPVDANNRRSSDFSVRWTGQLEARWTADTRFFITGDIGNDGEGPADPAWYRIYVDGRLVAPTARPGQYDEGSIHLQAGRRYELRVEAAFPLSRHDGRATLRLAWETPFTDARHIEQRFLHPSGYTGLSRPAGLGPLAHWRLDEPSGTTATDASGLGNTATLSGPARVFPGARGNALEFTADGPAQTLTAPLSLPAAATVAFWFRATGSHGGLYEATDSAGTPDRGAWLDSGRLHARIRSGTTTETIATPAGLNLADGAWHHAVHVHGGGVHRLYIDGALRAAGAFTELSPASDRVVFGRSAFSPVPRFAGRLDEIRLHDRALGHAEVEDRLWRPEAPAYARYAFESAADLRLFPYNPAGLTYAPGREGNALTLQNAYVLLDNELRLPKSDYSLALWVRTSAANVRLLSAERFSVYNNKGEDNILSLSSGRPVLGVGGRTLTGPATINNNQWRRLVLTVSETTGARLYVDGALAAESPEARRHGVTSERVGLTLGSSSGSNPAFSIDDLRVFGRALSADEVAALDLATPITPAPAPTPAAGAYFQSVTLSVPAPAPGATVRYTTDGSAPTVTSPVFPGSLTLITDTTLRLRAFVPGIDSSPIVTAAYTLIAPGSTHRVFSTNPGASENFHGTAREYGLKFRPLVDGTITAIRFFRTNNDTVTTRTGRLWTSNGTPLASAVFSSPNASGWQQVTLATPVAVTAGTTYVVSVNSGNSSAYQAEGLATPIRSGALESIADGQNGVQNDTSSAFPSASFDRANFFRDVVFVARDAPPPTPHQAWREQYFGTRFPVGQAADDADPDGDGVPNLLEYALAQNPLVPGSAGFQPAPALTPSLPPSLTLTFLRARAELTYTVEASSDLTPVTWQTIATNPGTVSLTEPVTVTDPEPASPRRFLRLRVQ
jgi:hypothetical protein